MRRERGVAVVYLRSVGAEAATLGGGGCNPRWRRLRPRRVRGGGGGAQWCADCSHATALVRTRPTPAITAPAAPSAASHAATTRCTAPEAWQHPGVGGAASGRPEATRLAARSAARRPRRPETSAVVANPHADLSSCHG
eukprot:scaffold96303_cov51-Phaeocystis_antarctica.AAC.1